MSDILNASPFQLERRSKKIVIPRHVDYPKATFRGLTHVLRDSFYPSYRYGKVKRKLGKDKKDAKTGLHRGVPCGRSLGIRIDRELTTTTKKNKKSARYHPYTRTILTCLEQRGYQPIATQTGVGCLDLKLRLFTAVDLIAQFLKDKKDGVILIEVKSYKTRYYEVATGKLKKPYSDRDNHPRNQHQLQLGWTRWLFQQTFPSIPILGCFVLRVHENGVHVYPLESWVLDPSNLDKALKRMSR